MSLSDLSYPGVQYARTGLKTVVCQVRFNPILRIGQELPADFQDLVRQAFPKFSKEESAEFRIAPGAPIEALPRTSSVWRFKTEDEAWSAGLAVESMSLETSQYTRFADFEQRFSILQEALQSTYAIDHYVRVGLRYINIFTPDEFSGGWRDWFNNRLLGVAADPDLGTEVKESQQIFVLARDDWSIKVFHATEGGGYRLDIDHATIARVDAREVMGLLRAFKERIYHVFRWAISEEMHRQMEAEARG